MKPMPTISNLKVEKPNFMPICNQGEFFVEPKNIKQGIALEEVPSTVEIPEEIDLSLEGSKGIVHDKRLETLAPMEDIPHHGTVILHVFNDPFQHNKYAQDYRIQRFLN